MSTIRHFRTGSAVLALAGLTMTGLTACSGSTATVKSATNAASSVVSDASTAASSAMSSATASETSTTDSSTPMTSDTSSATESSSAASSTSASAASGVPTKAQLDKVINSLKSSGAVTTVMPQSTLDSIDTSRTSTKSALQSATVDPSDCKDKLLAVVDKTPSGVPRAGGMGTGTNTGFVVLTALESSAAKDLLSTIKSYADGCPSYTIKSSSTTSTNKVSKIDGVSADGLDDVLSYSVATSQSAGASSSAASTKVSYAYGIKDNTLVEIFTTASAAQASDLSRALTEVSKAMSSTS